MKPILKYITKNRDAFLTFGLFSITGLIFIFLFPWEGKFRYEFQKSKPWQHDEFIAPFDFPIYKTDSEMDAEKDSLLGNFKPYFRYQNDVVQTQLDHFKVSFNKGWTDLVKQNEELSQGELFIQADTVRRNNYLNFAANLISFVYSKGIVQSDEILERVNNPDFTIVIIREKVAEERILSEVFTPRTAYEYVLGEVNRIADSIPDRIDRVFFRNLNINEFLIPNLAYDEETSESVKKEMISKISLSKGMVQSGERIISRGEMVTNEKFRILESLQKEYETKLGLSDRLNFSMFGRVVLALISMIFLYLFLYHFRKSVLVDIRNISFILLLIILITIIASLTLRHGVLSIYVIPFAIVPIMIRTFFDSRLALFVHLLLMLMVGFWAPNSFEFVFLNITAGMVSVFSLTNSYRRGILFQTAVAIVLTYSTVYFAFSAVQEANLSTIDYRPFLWFAGNGLLILTAYPLIFIFEKSFGFISESTLFELSDSNQPLLRKLSETAPGSFQHSLQVANLAEEVIYEIGGNSLLVRTGSLYHDIGKMTDPLYYIENQAGDFNPHDNLEFEKSAGIIIGHVTKGVEIAKKYKIPEPVTNFIRTHHGTTLVQYFYRSFLKEHPAQEADMNRFLYPGPRPGTRETAVVMMADSVEASSRSLKVKNEETLKGLVDSIINEQIRLGQFDDAPITFGEIKRIKEILITKLINIHHVRIEYPR